LLPFKKGAFHLAVQAQVPIVPVVCENYYHLFDTKTRMDRGDLTIRGEQLSGFSVCTELIIPVLPPISTEGMTSEDVDQLVESTRSAMVTALEAISRPGPSHRTNIKLAPEDLQTPLAELPRQLGESTEEESSARRNRRE
jgi:1-acyl-sn-glycerol-3-phosphate acyltransferase